MLLLIMLPIAIWCNLASATNCVFAKCCCHQTLHWIWWSWLLRWSELQWRWIDFFAVQKYSGSINFSVQLYTVYSIQYTVHSIQYTVYSIQYTQCNGSQYCAPAASVVWWTAVRLWFSALQRLWAAKHCISVTPDAANYPDIRLIVIVCFLNFCIQVWAKTM